MKRVVLNLNGTVQVFRLGTTTNSKITDPKVKILQTYIFSEDQFNYIRENIVNKTRANFNKFFSLDTKNCFDCPFSSNSNNGTGKCYTHKFRQYISFVSILKSIVNEYKNIENIPTYSSSHIDEIVKFSINRYVRFGTYGEPTLHPIELVRKIADSSSSWTGYTHQYVKNEAYNDFFMASTHNQLQANTAKNRFNFRSFIAVNESKSIKGVICPASKEVGFKSTCSSCGLCSGNLGKGKKDVKILVH